MFLMVDATVSLASGEVDLVVCCEMFNNWLSQWVRGKGADLSV